MILPAVTLLPAVALTIAVFFSATIEGTQDLLGALGRLQNAVRPRHCGHLYDAGQIASGLYTIYHKAAGESGQLTRCIMSISYSDWMVVMERNQKKNSIFSFYKNWTEYASGFGSPEGEFWIGNRALHALTSGEEQMTLKVLLRKHDFNFVDMEYGRFKISSEEDYFRISVSDYNGPEGWDTLTRANSTPFQTFDRHSTQNGEHVNCAAQRRGAWWYTSNCEGPNLTGVNFNGEHIFPGTGIQWLNHSLEGVDWSRYSYLSATMMIKPAGSGRYPRRR